MATAYEIVQQLTTRELPTADRTRGLRDFARELGWRPSYYLVDRPYANGVANAHLIVEHGLEPSAVITFLDRSRRLHDLQAIERNRLFQISYNNLVDWHLYVESDHVSICYNRTDPPTIETKPISRVDYSGLRNEVFDQIVGRKPNPNIPSLDEALIRTISYWKRSLAAELEGIDNEDLSALFNAIMFVRAVEDTSRHVRDSDSAKLVEVWTQLSESERTVKRTITLALGELVSGEIPGELISESSLEAFDRLDRGTPLALFNEFYCNRHAPYDYDFSLMSKHALSRIYEHYVSLLSSTESLQTSFFPRLPEEQWSKEYGSIYTPQFIARFFSRFLRDQVPPRTYRQLKTVDPACGSGLFLRTQLELQCDPAHDGVDSQAIESAFENAWGIDIDGNASQATRLSLASLYLVLTGKLPRRLNIFTADSFGHYESHPELRGYFDAVIVNPPFLSVESLGDDDRQRITEFMSDDATGRIDSYLAYLRLSLELLRPGGYGLFVLPHSFLISRSGSRMRRRIADEASILCLADLSAIRVFGDVGSYVILLAFRKDPEGMKERPPAGIVKCQDFVGHAFEDFLDGRQVETPLYSVYEVGQEEFSEPEWIILPPVESRVRRKMRNLPSLSDLAHVQQGLITGADDIFIVDESAVPDGEHNVFRPLLADREMRRYDVPERTAKSVFYPVVDGRKLTEDELRNGYPQTWQHLMTHREKLEARKPVIRGNAKWWELAWPRNPRRLFRSKITTPHLVITPKFSLDLSGRYAVSHTLMVVPKEDRLEQELLRFLLAVMNSPVFYWYAATHSHKYSRGYTMLEAKTLKPVPVPDPASIAPGDMQRLLGLVDSRLEGGPNVAVEREIDDLVATFYELTEKERNALGVAG